MDPQRSAKRRKLETGNDTKPAHEAWQEAKAKSQGFRGRRAVNVYDDIDGAHSPLKKKAGRGPAKKKQLDPLRNQNQNQNQASSPAATSRGAAALGFFKQFHSPKPKEDAGGTNGVEGDERGSSDEEDDSAPVRSTGKPGWKGWAYDDKLKKTFEDEIKDLAEAARERAENGEDGETIGVMPQQRKSKKKPSLSRELGGEKDGDEVVPKSTPKRAKVTQRPKTNHVDFQSPHAEGVSNFPDPMEVDDSGEKVKDDAKAKQLAGGTPTKSKPQHQAKAATVSKKTTFNPNHLQQIQTILLEKLAGQRPIRLTNLESEYAKVSNLITQTITAGESNSMLLIGARGCGKTALVNQILREETKEHENEFHVVRLNGFIHTDDKIALREIWRQLGREMELGDEESTSKNYADTLTTLLALLSHPTEQGREQQPDQVTKSVIFIIDEFELFASHPRQTLLYNLFDIAQSRKAPIAVLGLTTRVDVAESLEKRVKSRFSHRYVHLGLAKSLATFQEACKSVLTVYHDELGLEEREVLGESNPVADKLHKASKTPKRTVLSDWNGFVEELMAHDAFLNHLRRIYYTTKSVAEFHTSMLLPLSTITATETDSLLPQLLETLPSSSLHAPDSKLSLLPSLSTLQLSLLISAARLTTIHNIDPVPFAQAYEEYKVLASKAKLQASASGALAQGAGSRIWSKAVAKGAWEELGACGLVLEESGRGGRVDVGLEEIGLSGAELGAWGRWCREI